MDDEINIQGVESELRSGKSIDSIVKKHLNMIGDKDLKENVKKVIENNRDLYDVIERIGKEKERERIKKGQDLYLSEMVEKDGIEFGSNNLIIAPVGSGKSTLIKKLLKENTTAIQLVNNNALKDSQAPVDNVDRANQADRTYTTQNKDVYGDGSSQRHIMTYAEFGKLIEKSDEPMEDVEQIFCDEIHALPEYKNYAGDERLIHAIRYLFQRHEGKQIFYFTATKYNLEKMPQKPLEHEYMKIVDYTERKGLYQYKDLSTSRITHVNQIIPYIKDRRRGFELYGHKGIAFSRRIEEQIKISKVLEGVGVGIKPIMLWSENNEDYPLNEIQKDVRRELLTTGIIPEPYNFLIINSAMREGWNLRDEKVKYAIINSSNETDIVQARGRVRQDVDLLIYRAYRIRAEEAYIKIPEKYIGTPLTSKDKCELVNEIQYPTRGKKIMSWKGIKKALPNSFYEVRDTRKTINGEQVRVSTITNRKINK